MTENTVSLCAWCPDAEQAKADYVAEGVQVTHGICLDCETRYFGEEAYGTPRRRLTRNQRLQLAADAGIDTWADYRGEV